MNTGALNKAESTVPTRSVGVKGLVSALIFVAVWLAGCVAADYVFHLDADVWRMAWGYLSGTTAYILADLFYVRCSR